MSTDFHALVHKVLAAMVVDSAGNVEDLNEGLKMNRHAIDMLGTERPDLWDALKVRTQARRAALQAAGKIGEG